jgi:iron complex outermembrane recepter protein
MYQNYGACQLGRCESFRRIAALLLALVNCSVGLSAESTPSSAGATNEIEALAKLPFDELMQQPVTTVARKGEKLSEVPAAIEVLSQEDIRRLGVLSIPEALRWVPGMDVARIDGHRYAISARGFNDEFANKLLVLMDGRSIYTPLFGGVYWDQQNTLMEDIDRIEVIRGPGGTLWGPNAVNGIISVITKSARDTQGALLSGATGSEEHWYAAGRYGGHVGTNVFYRVYGNSYGRDDLAGGDLADGWRNNQGGFRLDWEAQGNNLVTFQGDYYQGDAMETLRVLTQPAPATFALITRNNAVEYSGGNLLGRWTHSFHNGSQSRLQLYYDHLDRADQVWTRRALENTFDVDFDHRFRWGERQELVWGLGNRVTVNEKQPTLPATFVPQERTLNFFSAFVQDEIRLLPERLSFFAGTKVQHNTYTAWEFQPSGRLVWSATDRQTLWAAVTRAVRTPTRVDADLRSTVTPGGLLPVSAIEVFGNPGVKSEIEYAYELGYRVQPVKRLAFDLAAFYNDYENLVSYRPVGINLDVSPPVVSLLTMNSFSGKSYGGEIAARWEVLPWWRLRPSYTFFEVDLRSTAGDLETAPTQQEGGSPQHQFALRSEWDLPRNFEFDAALRYVDRLPALDIPSYVTLDLRLGWRPTRNLEIAIVGQNLVESKHAEFRTLNAPALVGQVQRSVYGKVTWRF